MKVYISAKQIGKRGNRIAECPYELQPVPETLRQLIVMLVTKGTEDYNRRREAEIGASAIPTEDEMDAMARVGRIGFGVPFGERWANLPDALDTALQGFEDGLYRVFVGEQEVETLDTPLALQPADRITIIRLVMLTGGYI